MKYTGRVVLFSLVVGSSIIFIYYYYNINQEIKPIEVYLKLPFLVLAWYLGKKYDEAKFYSEKDALTGIYNRRFFYKKFPKLLSLIDKKQGTLNLFVIDIDNFKTINDTYGHEIGDKVIRKISESLIKNTRKTDTLVRWGGDEFLLIAPFSNETNASVILERIEKGLDQLKEQWGISVSIGISTYPNQANNIDGLVRAADKNMYENKLMRKEDNRSLNIDHPLFG